MVYPYADTLIIAESGKTFHLAARHPNHITADFTVHGHPSTSVLMALEGRIYLIGNQNLAHVWSLDVSQNSLQNRGKLALSQSFAPYQGRVPELAWKQEHVRGFPRLSTKPTHKAGCPRVGFTWRNNLVVIGCVKCKGISTAS